MAREKGAKNKNYEIKYQLKTREIGYRRNFIPLIVYRVIMKVFIKILLIITQKKLGMSLRTLRLPS